MTLIAFRQFKNRWLLLSLGWAVVLASPSMPDDKTSKAAGKKEAGKSDTFTLKVPVDVVVVNAIVTDKQEKLVKDLTKDDFKVYEDGKLQPIHTFSLESYKAVEETGASKARVARGEE